MLKTIILFFVIIFSTSVNSIYSQNQTDSQGRKQGAWKVYDEATGSLKYKGTFKDGEPSGKFIYYYPTGEVSAVIEHFGAGKAKAKMYHVNKSLMAVGNYVDQKKDSTWWYFNAAKQVTMQENYKNGKLHGYVLKYYPTNDTKKLNTLEEYYYENGLTQGIQKQYYENGKVKMEANHKDGHQEGKTVWYSSSGKMEKLGYYKHNVKNGWWRTYDEYGEEDEKVYYYHGSILEGEILEKYLAAKKKRKEQENAENE